MCVCQLTVCALRSVSAAASTADMNYHQEPSYRYNANDGLSVQSANVKLFCSVGLGGGVV